MFKFLKEKLGKVLGSFSKKVKEETEKEKIPEIKPEPKEEKKTIPKPIEKEKQIIAIPKTSHPSNQKTIEAPKATPLKAEHKIPEKKQEQKKIQAGTKAEPVPQPQKEEKKGFLSKIFTKEQPEKQKGQEAEHDEKKGFFGKVTESFTKFHLSDEKFEELFWDLEVTLLENNVAVEVIEKIKKDLKEELTTGKISRKNPDEIIKETLTRSITEILDIEKFDLIKEIHGKKPYIIAVIGVNGSGKTTAIAKLVNYLQKRKLSVVVAASDTFRAAAIQQLERHMENLGTKLIKHDYNSDPAAVAFDAVKHAQAKGIDVVLIDTAGRLHSNDNLMNELKKLIKVNKPDLKLFVGESITGNDCVEQAKIYNEQIGIDGIILTKADIDEKGGAALSISYVVRKPLLFIGTGQGYDDLKPFDKDEIIQNLGLA